MVTVTKIKFDSIYQTNGMDRPQSSACYSRWPSEARLRDDITYRYVSYLYSEPYIEEWMSSEYTSAESPMCIREGIRECNGLKSISTILCCPLLKQLDV